MSSKKTLFLLDAYALIYRAHFAFTKNPRINSKGMNTSVPFGFTNTLLEVLQKQKPTHIAVVFDTAAPTFRDEIFKAYKATRQEIPEDVRYGIPKVKEIIDGFNIPCIEFDGYEADDVIGTLAKRAVKQGFTVYMMTPDKDFGQLVEDEILLYKPAYMGNAVDVMGKKEVCARWDIADVNQVKDMLGLQGDTSDNIPGVPGIGPKTAAALIKQFGSVEEIVAHAGELKGRQKELLEEFGEQAILSKQLATIVTDVPIKFDDEALTYTGPDENKLKPIFLEMEFRTFINRLFSDAQGTPTPPMAAQLSMFGSPTGNIKTTSAATDAKQYETVDAATLVKKFSKKTEEIGISILSGPEEDDRAVMGVAVAVEPGKVFYVAVASLDHLEQLRGLFENEKIRKTGQNIKAMLLALCHDSLTLKGTLFDTMVAHYLIEPEAAHDLEILANQYLDYPLVHQEDPVQNLCERADVALQLRPRLEKELVSRGQLKLMNEIEMPLVTVLAGMEYEGVNIDLTVLARLSDELRVQSEKIQKQIFSLSGHEFNINSPKQLGEVLFEELQLADKVKKTRTGQYATGEEVLLKLSGTHEIIQKILDYREYEKLRSTYVDALPKMTNARDGRIHTDYRQTVAATGRLSSNNPNLQNIPIRTEKGREIRKAFVPRNKDYLFMSADYSQIELRIAASFARDKTMIEAFRSKRDIHATTAAKVFKVDLADVTSDMRRKAKEVNFGILYGSTVFGLSQNLNIPRSEAAEIIEAYFREFPAIKKYMDDSIAKAREQEYVETLMGRRRYLRDINSRNATTRGFAERNAINAPIQGTAADIIKIAMVNIYEELEKKSIKSRMILQVHDELVFDVHRSEADVVKSLVTKLMTGAVNLEVPMEVEVGVGKNWLEAH